MISRRVDRPAGSAARGVPSQLSLMAIVTRPTTPVVAVSAVPVCRCHPGRARLDSHGSAGVVGDDDSPFGAWAARGEYEKLAGLQPRYRADPVEVARFRGVACER